MKVTFKATKSVIQQIAWDAIERATDSYYLYWTPAGKLSKEHDVFTTCQGNELQTGTGHLVFQGSRDAFLGGEWFFTDSGKTTKGGRRIAYFNGIKRLPAVVMDVQSSASVLEARNPFISGDVISDLCRELEQLEKPPIHIWEEHPYRQRFAIAA